MSHPTPCPLCLPSRKERAEVAIQIAVAAVWERWKPHCQQRAVGSVSLLLIEAEPSCARGLVYCYQLGRDAPDLRKLIPHEQDFVSLLETYDQFLTFCLPVLGVFRDGSPGAVAIVLDPEGRRTGHA